MVTYRVTMQNFKGFKDFKGKHQLRLWLMNQLNKDDIKNLNVVKL